MSTDKRKEAQRCKTIKSNNERCKALAGQNGYCSVHSGLRPQLERKSNLEGGALEIRKFLAKIALSLKGGRLKAHDCNALVNICNCLLRCHEIIELEVKLKEISEKMKQPRWVDEQNPDLACLEDCIDLVKK